MFFSGLSSFGTILKPLIGASIFIAPLVLIPFDVYWIWHTGPVTYYNHFIGLLLATCLAFAAFQLLLLEKRQTTVYRAILRDGRAACIYWEGANYIYWAVVFSSGTATAVSYMFVQKIDCVCISFLVTATAIFAWKELNQISSELGMVQIRSPFRYSSYVDNENKNSPSDTITLVSASQTRADHDSVITPPRQGYAGRVFWSAVKWISLPIRPFHAMICVINVYGAITLALQERCTVPGNIISIEIPGHGHRYINYYCNDMSLIDPRAKPTIWFESTSAHGVLDFSGLQHYLALKYNFSSCSYDPPNYGRSGPLPAELTNHDLYLPALLKELGKEEERRVHVGWEGGLRYAIKHAIQDPKHITAVIDLDAAPDGIEYLNIQAQTAWNDTQIAAYRQKDLQKQIDKVIVMLSVGFSWGLSTLIFPPLTVVGFFPEDLYSSYKAQSRRDPYWTMQYYGLRNRQYQLSDDRYLTQTSTPSSVQFYAILNMDSVPGDPVSNEFYRNRKLQMAQHIANNDISMVEWCTDNCTALFPVDQAEWTAGIIAEMLGG